MRLIPLIILAAMAFPAVAKADDAAQAMYVKKIAYLMTDPPDMTVTIPQSLEDQLAELEDQRTERAYTFIDNKDQLGKDMDIGNDVAICADDMFGYQVLQQEMDIVLKMEALSSDYPQLVAYYKHYEDAVQDNMEKWGLPRC